MRALATRFGSKNSIVSNVPLTNDEIMRVAPSVMATEAHSSRSGKYSYISTLSIIDALRKEGFEPFMVCQSRPRAEDRFGFARHMVRLRPKALNLNGGANEVIIINDHSGTASHQLLGGFLEFACSNGLVTGDIMQDIRIPHRGNVIDNVIEGVYRVVEDFEKVDESRAVMQSIKLDEYEQTSFARAALALKFDDPEDTPITERQLLQPRRYDDAGNSLWKVFNRCQEGLIRGGIRGHTADNRRVTTRPVTGIDTNIKLNKALWILAEAMKSAKTH